jgi:hypothetical protein
MRLLELSSILVAASALGALGCSSGDNTAGNNSGNDAGNNNTIDAGGTGDDGGGGADAGCVPFTQPAVSTLQTPTISFVQDVLPVFQHSCVFSGCHQSTAGGLEYLGDNFSDASTYPATYATRVYNGLVNVATTEAPSMVFVKPNDPENSFTMRKMDNDICGLTAQCPANNTLFVSNYGNGQTQTPPTPCGVSMPKDQDLLEQTSADGGLGPREIVRRWIAQGAKNN